MDDLETKVRVIKGTTLWAKSADIEIDAHLTAGHGSRSWPIVLGPQMAHMTAAYVRYIITTVEL